MKTRIISGAILISIVTAFLVLAKTVSPFFLTAFIVIACAIGTYELVKNAAGITQKTAFIGSMVYSSLMIVLLDNKLDQIIFDWSLKELSSSILNPNSAPTFKQFIFSNWGHFPFVLTVFYFVFCVVMTLKFHKDFTLAKISVFCAMPLVLSYAFSVLGSIINNADGIYYLLLLLNFSAICDTGAYFVGVTCGKHKLCPEISPKKTIEGALGGIASSIVVGLILVFAFGRTEHIVPTLILTIPLCILGMLGDLFASAIKRSVNLKDYGSLIPGHGGVLDRVDSILMIAPVLYIFIHFGVI